MEEFDNRDFINIRITKKKFNGEFTHWEIDLGSSKANIGLEGTAPTIWGVVDLATEYLWEQARDNEWFADDANA